MIFPEQEKNFLERTGKEFSFFYKKYYPKLIYYTSRMCNDTQKAEDISTESFLIAFEKIDKYEKEKSQFSTWLFTIAKNLMLQDIKVSKKTMSLDVEIDEEGTTMKDFLQDSESEEYLHDLTYKKSKIMLNYISELKEPYKQVIEMREIKKMVYKDIASELGKDVDFMIVSDGQTTSLPVELSKVYSVLDEDGNEVPYTLIEGDAKKTPFYTGILLKDGIYNITGREPKSLSTVKSQIRNGRAILIEQTAKEFQLLDDMCI